MELQPDEIFLNPVFGYLSASQQTNKNVDVCFPVLYVTIGITNRISTPTRDSSNSIRDCNLKITHE